MNGVLTYIGFLRHPVMKIDQDDAPTMSVEILILNHFVVAIHF